MCERLLDDTVHAFPPGRVQDSALSEPERDVVGAFGRRKVCRYCADKNAHVDFKDQAALKYFVTERGKIIPRRISGNCAKSAQ